MFLQLSKAELFLHFKNAEMFPTFWKWRNISSNFSSNYSNKYYNLVILILNDSSITFTLYWLRFCLLTELMSMFKSVSPPGRGIDSCFTQISLIHFKVFSNNFKMSGYSRVPPSMATCWEKCCHWEEKQAHSEAIRMGQYSILYKT